MAFIQTVTGAVPSEELGLILPHEHLVTGAFVPGDDRIPLGFRHECQEWLPPLLRELAPYGCRTLVETTPIGLFRDVPFYREMSIQTGVNVVLCTGFYLEDRRPEPVRGLSIDELAQWMIRELCEGIDDTGVRAGIIKIAGPPVLSEEDKKIFQAAAIASRETGLSITTHSCNAVQSHFDFLISCSAQPSRLYIGHADFGEDNNEQRHVCDHDGHLIFTGWGIQQFVDQTLLYSRIPDLLKRGHGDKILLSVDFCLYIQDLSNIAWPTFNVPHRTYSYLFREVIPNLKEMGVTEDEINTMMIENPRRMLIQEGTHE